MKLKYFVQPTPNPNAMKFILNRDVLLEGKISYTDSDKCGNNKLAQDLLSVVEITQAHFFENVITVTQTGDVEWESLEDVVIEVLSEGIDAHDPDICSDAEEKARRAALSPEMRKIEEILDKHIRPGLQGDGGDIAVIDYNQSENIIKVQYQGACNTCPSSSLGTLMAIKGTLQDHFDPEIEVITLDS